MKKTNGRQEVKTENVCEGDRGGGAVVTPIVIENVKATDVELNSCCIM